MLSRHDLLLALLANFAWGFNFIAGKIGTAQFEPLFFTSIRFLFLLLIMLPWLKPAPGHMKPLLKVSFILGVVHFGMVFIGLNAGGNIASIAITTQLYDSFLCYFGNPCFERADIIYPDTGNRHCPARRDGDRL